jgi:hypothetical protein
MTEENESKSGEPTLPVDEYDKAHGYPCEQDVRANPTNQPEIGDRSFNVKG